MRTLPLLFIALAVGCDSKPNPHTPAAAPIGRLLTIGDAAPTLTVNRWLHGAPVTIEPGKVYVIDFWATWCGPCIKAMPHLNQLAKEFNPKGVEFITVTQADSQGSDLERVERYVATTGKNFAIHFGWCDTTLMYETWMAAAGQESIPCSFVIDQAGKIAYIGLPSKLDEVLPRVLAKTWRGQADLAEIQETEGKLFQIFNRVQAAGGNAAQKLPLTATQEEQQAVFTKAAAVAAEPALRELAEFEKEHPSRAASEDVLSQKMVLLMRTKQYDAAKDVVMPLLERLKADNDVDTIDLIRQYWLGKNLNPDRKHLEVPVVAGEMLIAMTDDDVKAVLAAAEANAAAGNTERYQVLARKARMLTMTDAERNRKVEALLNSFQK